MNYLAHILLSGNNPLHLVGNFMGDSVKGKDYQTYPSEISKGILLHRQIDSFMDQHPIVQKGKLRLHKNQSKFAGVVIDVFYDYFLAKNWAEFSDQDYHEFIQENYRTLENHIHLMPTMSQFILGRMVSSDWLGHYLHSDGINQALSGLSRRTKYPNNMENAVLDLLKYETEFNNEFKLFFPQIVNHCKDFIG
ncbi:MAG: DUF479 domain-containing protein [Flavobacteriales bacterium]|nr:DUF479 domain-containing protein [Flavobacteriales bacterium]